VKRILPVLLLFAALKGYGEDISIINSYFSPSQYYVGDEALLHLEILKEEGLSLSPVIEIPEHKWVDIRDVQLTEGDDSYRVVILFVSYFTGSQTLPDISIGDMTLSGLKIYTESLITEDNPSISEPKGNLLIPGTRTFLVFAAFLLIMIPLLVLGVFRKGWTFIRGLFIQYRHGQILKRLENRLELLRRDMAVLDDAEFYDKLIEALRGYLEARLEVPLSAATTQELNYFIGDRLEYRHKSFVGELFRYGDMVKFAHNRAPLGDRRDHMEGVDAMVHSLEGEDT